MAVDTRHAKLFWTGGWDSTFRLLQLLLIEKKRVQTYYIIDPSRKSASLEKQVMKKIRKHLFRKYPNTRTLLLPTVFIRVQEIIPDENIFRAWQKIKNNHHIGGQYKWLASYCKQTNVTNLELCYEKSTSTKSMENSILHNFEQEKNSGNYGTLFGNFSFVLTNFTKKEMDNIAKEQNWISILHMTWFCHRPFAIPFYGKVACGGCNPCLMTIEEGFGWRIPYINRLFGKHLKGIYNSSLFCKLRKF